MHHCHSHYFDLQIARRLLGKILIDLHNTQEEAIDVAEPKSNQETTTMFPKTRKEERDQARPLNKNEDPRRTSSTSEKSIDQDDDDDRETKYRLDPKFLSHAHFLLSTMFNIILGMLNWSIFHFVSDTLM